MIRKKLLFWAVWLLAVPFVFLFFTLRFRGSARAQVSYWRSGLVFPTIGLVRQAVYERLVTEKTVQRHLYNLYRKRR